MYWPITIKFRMRKQTSKPQTNYRCCLQFSYHAPYWLIPHNTITFHKYFWCSWFCEFHSKLQNIIRNKTQFQYKVEGGLHLGGLKLGVFFCLQVDGLITGGGGGGTPVLAKNLIFEGAYYWRLIIEAKGGLHPGGL